MALAKPEDRVFFAHATGNSNVRQAAMALEQAGMLSAFYTTIAWQPGSRIDRMLPRGMQRELARRSYPEISQELIHTQPWRETIRLLAIRRGWESLIEHETGRYCFDAVLQALEHKVANIVRKNKDGEGGVYAYDACALDIFEAAKKRGMRCIFDLPTGHYRVALQIAAEERELKPEWASTMAGIHDSAAKLERKDRELELADSILVASSFTASTLKAFPGTIHASIYRIGYGAPPVGAPRELTRRKEPLRVLFVGQMGQRKGLGYVIEAMDKLKVKATLTMLGRPLAMPPVMRKAIEQHRWIESAPHGEVLKLMREHDVLVFPSLFEGYGLVILEAMAQGTVVIATPHTGAPDLIKDDRDGFIVPIRSSDAIANKLTLLAEDRAMLMTMSEAARQTAARRTWDEYRWKLVEAVRTTLTA